MRCRLGSSIFRLVSKQFRLHSVCSQTASYYLVLMSFSLRPLCKHVTSNGCFVLTKGQGLSIEHDVDGLGDAQAEIFEGDGHGEGQSGALAARGGGRSGGREIRAQFFAGNAGDPLKRKDAINVSRKARFAPFVDGLRSDVECSR